MAPQFGVCERLLRALCVGVVGVTYLLLSAIQCKLKASIFLCCSSDIGFKEIRRLSPWPASLKPVLQSGGRCSSPQPRTQHTPVLCRALHLRVARGLGQERRACCALPSCDPQWTSISRLLWAWFHPGVVESGVGRKQLGFFCQWMWVEVVWVLLDHVYCKWRVVRRS